MLEKGSSFNSLMCCPPHHSLVAFFLYWKRSPNLFKVWKQTRKTLAAPNYLSPSESLSARLFLLLFELSGELDLTLVFPNKSDCILLEERRGVSSLPAERCMSQRNHPKSTAIWSSHIFTSKHTSSYLQAHTAPRMDVLYIYVEPNWNIMNGRGVRSLSEICFLSLMRRQRQGENGSHHYTPEQRQEDT